MPNLAKADRRDKKRAKKYKMVVDNGGVRRIQMALANKPCNHILRPLKSISPMDRCAKCGATFETV